MRMRIEWPTLGLLTATYVVWALAIFWLATISVLLAITVTALALTLHSSLQHEVIHGHPFQSRWLNACLVLPPLGIFVPFHRFRDTHLAHHRDSRLTDPYDDPESNYLDGGDWERASAPVKWLLTFNNTLAGRLIVGPLVGFGFFLRSDWRSRGEASVRMGWLVHVPLVAIVLAVVVWSAMPIWAYVLSCYAALSILKIRTFLEHRARDLARERTVIVEDRGPLALLFLNNNLHKVHHMHPTASWYSLPALYRRNRARYLEANGGYRYRSYGEVFAKYLLRCKDPVAHPLWRRN